MPPKVSSMLPSAAKKDDKPKRKKKKKKLLNEAQSQRLNDLQVRMYEDSLLAKFITEGPLRDEYATDITQEGLAKALETYAPALSRYCGHPDLVKEFCATRDWLNREGWREASQQYQNALYRAEMYGEEVESGLSDADETSEEEN